MGANFVNFARKKRFLSSFAGLNSIFHHICHLRPPNNDSPNNGALLIHVGVLLGVKNAHNRLFSGDT